MTTIYFYQINNNRESGAKIHIRSESNWYLNNDSCQQYFKIFVAQLTMRGPKTHYPLRSQRGNLTLSFNLTDLFHVLFNQTHVLTNVGSATLLWAEGWNC